MYDSIIKLAKTKITTDDIGNQVKTYDWESANELFCEIMSVSQSEFYAAAQAGFKPTLKIKLADYFDYNGEDKLMCDDEIYNIIRTYRTGISLEITAERNENEL